MPFAAGISAVGSIASSFLGMKGSQSAANAQVAAQQAALEQQRQFFDVLKGAAQPLINTGEDVLGAGQGVLSAGRGVLDTGLGYATSAADTLKKLLTPGANMTATLSQIPGFQFAQDWGQKAVQNLGTLTGLGGNTLTAGANYATGLAQQGFGSIVNSLQGLLSGGVNIGGLGTNLAGIGTNLAGVGGNIASSGVSSLGYGAGQFSGQASNTYGNIGNAQASGILGGTNALSGGLTGAANAGTLLSFINLLKGGGSGSGADLGRGIYNDGTLTGILGIGPTE